jgi:hypothetical protein
MQVGWLDVKQDPATCVQETHLTGKVTHKLKVKKQKTYTNKWKPKANRISSTHFWKINLWPKRVRRDKEGHYILVKRKKSVKKL